MYKKILTLVLAIALTALALTGCGGKSSSSSSSSSSKPMQSSSMMDSSIMDDSMMDDNMMDSSMMDNSMMDDSMMDNSMIDESGMNMSSSEAAPAAASADAWKLVLVNPSHSLPQDFVADVTPISGYPERTFDTRAVKYLEDMMAAAKADGYPCYLVSAYRTVSYQEGLFNRKVQSYLNQGYSPENAKIEAAKWVAPAGTSEHNLGLAADIVSGDWYTYNSDLTTEFENTSLFSWLQQHCAEYGFILRYPKDKEDITGIHYEPWHYRYVGVEAAKKIMQQGITLEEYLQK